MIINKKEIAKILEGIAERLDEAVTEASIIDVDDEAGYREVDYDVDMDDDADQIESEIINTENRINEIKLVLSEEIDNIRRLVEVLE